MVVFSFVVYYHFCQYIDEGNEENLQNMLININFCQYFANILWMNLHTTFILQNFGLKFCKWGPMAWNINRKLTSHANLHIGIITEQYSKKLIDYANMLSSMTG